MDLNRFSIFNRLSQKQIDELCTKFEITYLELRDGVVGRKINFEWCDYICSLLGYKKWYPEYHPRKMGGDGKFQKRPKKLDNAAKNRV